MRTSYLFLLFLFPFLSAQKCSETTAENVQETVFTNVTVIPMTEEGKTLTNQNVVVQNGKITTIGAQKPTKGATIIDGTGKYLMPGIAEMHAHIPVPDDRNESLVEETLFLYLSNGITTIRGMLGNSYHLELREKVKNGQMLGPRIYTSSPSMNGNSVPTIEVAKEKVRQYKKDGYDFLKIHPGIQRAVFDEMVKTANEVGIPYSGHVPNDVGIERAIEAKYSSIDHIDGYVNGLALDTAHPDSGGFFGYAFASIAEMEKMENLIQKTKENDIWIVPTQSLFTRWFSPTPALKLVNEPEMKYMNAATRFQWRQNKERLTSDPNYREEQYGQFLSIRKQFLKKMDEAGVKLLLGSDAPQVFNVPGFSIQHEMQAMEEAGLSNYTILESGTSHPAKFFNQIGEYGVVQEGASADLILLNDNPLHNIQQMKNIAGVMVQGQWLSKSEIDEKLAAIAKKKED